MAQSTQAKKLATITAEVESLKVVLEMRTEEIHNLRNENVRLGEKIEEYDSMKIELSRATAQAEDLKAQLNSRLDLERYVHYHYICPRRCKFSKCTALPYMYGFYLSQETFF